MKQMQRFILILALITVPAVSAAQEKRTGPIPKGPVAQIEAMIHDFGEMKSGDPLRHSFKVKNVGDSDLLIEGVAVSCGCTASDFTKTISPGKEGSITLAIEQTTGYSGEMLKTATVTTNDPRQKSFVLSLRARFKAVPMPTVAGPVNGSPPAGIIAGPFAVEPTNRWTTAVLSGSIARGTLYLYNPGSKPVRVRKIVPGGDGISVSLQPIQDGKRYEVKVASKAGLKPGTYSQVVRLETDSNQGVTEIQLDLTVYPIVFATPQAIQLPTIGQDTDVASLQLPQISIRKVRDGGLKIKNISSTLPFLNLKLAPESDGTQYGLFLSIDKSKIEKPGRYSGKITIVTNDPDSPTLNVDVNGMIR